MRGGGMARRRAAWLLAHEKDSSSAHSRWVDVALRRTLESAIARLPAYASLRGRLPQHDLARFMRDEVPLLDKPALRKGREAYYPRAGRPLPWWALGKTSGTSGMPLEVFRSFDSVLWEQAFAYQHWAWAGQEAGDRQVVLRGDVVVPAAQTHGPFWVEDKWGNSLYVSTRHVCEQHAAAIAGALESYQGKMLRAYPSAAFELAKLTLARGLPIRFKSVQTSSEGLHPLQRQTIEAAFGAQVFDLYGMAERVAFGMECEHGRMHLNPFYSHVEILDSAGQPTDGLGQIVGTTLLNQVMPLLRYRLSDLGRWDPSPCPCGRNYPVIKVETAKLEDQVFDLDGNAVSPSVITFAFKGVAGIAKSQVAQIAADQWELRLVPASDFNDACVQQLLANFCTLVSPRLNASIRLCTEIPNLPSGKFKWVVQEWGRARQDAPSGEESHAL